METISVKTLLIEIRDLLQSNKAVLTVDEFVAYSGIKKSQVYKLTSQRRIPHYKPPGSKRVFFRKREVQQWLLNNPVRTRDEVRKEVLSKIQMHLK
jgi:excisionase family DNA binding protein